MRGSLWDPTPCVCGREGVRGDGTEGRGSGLSRCPMRGADRPVGACLLPAARIATFLTDPLPAMGPADRIATFSTEFGSGLRAGLVKPQIDEGVPFVS